MIRVTAAILVKNGKVFIAKRNSSDKLANKWEFPGGKVEAGETFEQCLRRELLEEFGIIAEIGEFFGESIYCYKDAEICLLGFWAYWKSGQLSPSVHNEYKWVYPKELIKYDFAPADLPFVRKLRSEGI